MAVISGFTGAFTSANATNDAAVTSWSGTLSIDANKIEPAFGEKWRRTVLGAGEFTGSLTANLVRDVANSAPFVASDSGNWASMTGVAIVLTLDATATATKYTFTGCLFNITTSFTNGGVAQLTADFANTSTDFAVGWDEAV